jgi:hypothetical protein
MGFERLNLSKAVLPILGYLFRCGSVFCLQGGFAEV